LKYGIKGVKEAVIFDLIFNQKMGINILGGPIRKRLHLVGRR